VKTSTIQINDKDVDKFMWLLRHFNEIKIIADEDIDKETVKRLIKYSNDYKSGKREEFEELNV